MFVLLCNLIDARSNSDGFPFCNNPALPFQEDILADRAARKIRIEQEMAQEQRRQARLALSTRVQKEKPGLAVSSFPQTFVRGYDSVRVMYNYVYLKSFSYYTYVVCKKVEPREVLGQLLGDIIWICYMFRAVTSLNESALFTSMGKDYRGHLYSPFLPSYTVSTKMVFWKLLQVMLAITFLKGAVHKFTLNLWMSRYGRLGLGRFNLRQPHFRCEPLPAYALQHPTSCCFSHWGGMRLKIFFICTTLLAWAIQKGVGGASGKHTSCTLQLESTTGEWWNFSWNLALTRIRLLDLLTACSQHQQATRENSMIHSCMIRNYDNIIYVYVHICDDGSPTCPLKDATPRMSTI